MSNVDNIPSELLENRHIVEGNFIFCLWKEPDLFDDFTDDIVVKDFFVYKDSMFFYVLGKKMWDLGYESFDDTTITLFLEDKPDIKKQFHQLDGFATIKKMIQIVNTDNIFSYYDELIKINSLVQLNEQGFAVVENMDKFKLMTSDEVSDYFEFILNDVMLKTSSTIEIEDLYIDDDFIEQMDAGMEMGLDFSRNCPILNYSMMGLPVGDLTMLAGHSGSGKTSFAFANFVIPIVEDGTKTCIISNEQRAKDFKVMLASMELANNHEYYGLSRKDIKMGNFNDEQKAKLRQVARDTEEKYKDKLKFVRMFDYDLTKIKRVIKRLSKLGFELFVFDTMKSQNLQDNQFWQSLVEDSKDLFQLVDKEQVAMVTTYQLALHTLNQRYLDANCLSNAKQIKEVYSEMVYFRELWADEYNEEDFDVEPFRRKKDKSGKYTDIEEPIILDREKTYLVLFVDKTRNDKDGLNLIYEFDGAYNVWRELGFCTVQHGRRY